MSHSETGTVHNPQQENTLIEDALAYERLGWFILPISPNKKQPIVKWAHRKDNRPSADEIKDWWRKWPDARIGMATGKLSGVNVVDFDGPDALKRFEATVCELPQTITQSTGRDEYSFHAFFDSGDHDLKNQAGVLDGVDIRAEGGIVILAPSAHKSGKRYKWGRIDPKEHGIEDLLDMPAEMVDFLKQTGGKQKNTTVQETTGIDSESVFIGVPEGQRDTTLFKFACRLRGKNLSWDEGKILILTAAESCHPPFPKDEAIKKLEQAWKYPPGEANQSDQPDTLISTRLFNQTVSS